MSFQQQLADKREQYHISVRRQRRDNEPFINESRRRFIEMMAVQLAQPLIPFETALSNIKQNISFAESLKCLASTLKTTTDPKLKLKRLMLIFDRGILHFLSSTVQHKIAIQETLQLVVEISCYPEKNTGNHIIRSGILLHLFEHAYYHDKQHASIFLAILGNICYEDADNRNAIGDTEIHFDIAREISDRIKLQPGLYSSEAPKEQKKLWLYKLWFLQMFYNFDVLGEKYPPQLIESLLSLLSIAVPYEVLERTIGLLVSLKIDHCYYEELGAKVELLLRNDIKQEQVTDVLYLISQINDLPIRNPRSLLVYYNPEYFGVSMENNRCQSYITRILYARKNELDNIPELHQDTFWQNIINKSLPTYDRYMVMSILNSINLQDVTWVFEHLSVNLNQNQETVEILAGLNFISTQIDQKGKEIIGVLIQRTGLDHSLNKLNTNESKEVYDKLQRILQLYD